MSSIHLVIEPGGEVKSLYRDELKPMFDALGSLEITRRASDIIFHNNQWYVCEITNIGERILYPEGFDLRQDAINFEVEVLQKKYL